MNEQIDIEKLLPWSAPKLLQTKRGARMLRKSKPGLNFEEVWNKHRTFLVANGISYAPAYNNPQKMEVLWWTDPPAEYLEKTKASLEGSHAMDAAVDIPCNPGLEYRGYQKAGMAYALARNGTLLADEMGLGKTVQAIGVINARPDLKTGLVVAPANLKINWYRELKRFLTRPMTVWLAEPHIYPRADIVIINYDLLKKYERFLTKEFDFIIIDECHLVKNPAAQRTQIIFGREPKPKKGDPGRPPISARIRLALTGTPIPNKVEEIFPVLHYLDPVSFPSEYQFRYKYAGAMSLGGHADAGNGDFKLLQQRLRETVMIRRLKSQVLTELPPKTREILEFEHDSPIIRQERQQWDEDEADRAKLEAAIEIAKALGNRSDFVVYTKQLAANMAIKFEEMAAIRRQTAEIKLPYYLEYLHTCIDNGQKIVSFCHHRFMIEAVYHEFGKAAVIHYGDLDISTKQQAVDRFQQDDRCRLFSGSLTASGTGLTLHASSHSTFGEHDWRPSVMIQCEDRLHRIGQRDAVTSTYTALKDSVDVNMLRAQIAKQAIADAALDDADRISATSEAAVSDRICIGLREYQQAATTIADKQLPFILAGVKQIEANHQSGTAGFNAADAEIIQWLAHRQTIDKRSALLGLRLVQKYQKQIPEELLLAAEGKE